MKESTSVPFDGGAWDPTGLFVYEMYFLGKKDEFRLELPCLLQDAMLLGNRHRKVCESRPTGGWWKPQSVQNLGRYQLDLSGINDDVAEHVKRLPKTFLFDPAAGEMWCGSLRLNLTELIYAVGHIAENHPLRSTGLRMIGLDVNDEKSYKPALLRAFWKGASEKVFLIPTYGAIESPCGALDHGVLPQIEGSQFLAFNNVVINTALTTFISFHKSTHQEHESLAQRGALQQGLDVNGVR